MAASTRRIDVVGASPAWAERQIVVSIPQLGDVIVNGKLDAVFHGGLDANDPTKQYTIVDWKTGRKPRKPQDIEHKLVQLDWYRLLLSYIEHVPLDRIDATLYYLSEPDEGRARAARPRENRTRDPSRVELRHSRRIRQ